MYKKDLKPRLLLNPIRYRSVFIKSRLIPFLIFILALTFAQSCTQKPVDSRALLLESLSLEMNQLKPGDGQWGVLIIDLSEGDTLIDFESDIAFRPASLTKLFTMAVAENILPTIDFASMIVSETLNPDSSVDTLYWHGPGVPLMGEDNLDSLFNIGLNKVKDAGIKKINDAIVIVDFSDKESFYPGWTMEDASSWFASHPSAISSRSNLWEISIQREGDSLTYTIIPDSPYKPALILEEKDEFLYRWHFGGYQIPYLLVGFPSCLKQKKMYVPMFRPELIWGEELHRSMVNMGLGDEALPVVFSPFFPRKKAIVNSYPAIGLDSLIILSNCYSNNFVAESILHSIGLKVLNIYGRVAGLAAVDTLLATYGFTKDHDYDFWDGSGMSRYNWVTPGAVAKLILEKYYDRSLELSLSETGKSGKLENRLGAFPPGNKIRGKTGSMNGVRNFAGIIRTANNKNYLAVFMVNQYTVKTVEIDKKMREILLKLTYN